MSICVYLLLIFPAVFLFACRTAQKTDMRTLAPAETLVYLESNDLGETLRALTENEAWKEAAQAAPDFSAFKNVQIAVAVHGFEASEKQITGESVDLNFKPRFVLIADTHRWQSTAASIAENQIGNFARKTYGDDVKLEKSSKRDAAFFVWANVNDSKRKLFSAVSGGVIYVGNDETLIDKCLAVSRGEAESLSKNENLARARGANENLLAFGYVSPEGIAQIANLAGVSVAVESSEENVVRSFIAKILPGALQKTAKEIVWSARKTNGGIEDTITVKTDGEVSSVLKETLVPAAGKQFSAAKFLPVEFDSITRYNLQNPPIAWRSVLLVAARQTDAGSAKILTAVADSFFEPFGVTSADDFLNAAGAEIVTARFDEEGDKQIVIAEVRDVEKIKKSVAEEINFKAAPEKVGAGEIWKSTDGELAAAFVEDKLILGEKASVLNCLQAGTGERNFSKTIQFQYFLKNSAPAATIARDAETAGKIVEVLGTPGENKNNYAAFYTTVTSFGEAGIKRRIVSDFGLIGTIIEKLGDS